MKFVVRVVIKFGNIYEIIKWFIIKILIVKKVVVKGVWNKLVKFVVIFIIRKSWEVFCKW